MGGFAIVLWGISCLGKKDVNERMDSYFTINKLKGGNLYG